MGAMGSALANHWRSAPGGWRWGHRVRMRGAGELSFGRLNRFGAPNYYAAFVRDLDGYRIEAVLGTEPTKV